MDLDAMSDGRTIGGKSFATWVTNWTDCTNATFSQVLRYSNSSLHKEVRALSCVPRANCCQSISFIRLPKIGFLLHFLDQILAVLAAITEIIKERKGSETETEYFGALVS